MPSSTLTSKGQITLPKAIREHLRVGTGDAIDFVVGADGEVRVRAGDVDVSELKGLLRQPGRRPVSVEQMDAAIRRAHGGRR
jgi:AbrB family looped-hinge helix DNA binding protein